MNRFIAIIALTLADATLFGCTAPHPAIRDGNADTVEVSYGGDVASAWPLARKHCAQYERVPQLVDRSIDLALFDCIKR